jgi:hypothetical protein
MNNWELTFAYLASKLAQEKYIEHGTVHEYLLPNDLLDTAYNILFEQKKLPIKYDPILEKLKTAILACEIPEKISNSELIHNFIPWNEVRTLSGIYLNNIGYDLNKFENDEL